MESIAPPLKLIIAAKKALDRGTSVRAGISEYLQSEQDPWKEHVMLWSIKLQQGLDTSAHIESQKTIYRKQTLRLLERGLRGESVYSQLVQLEKEISEQVDQQIDEFIARLPYMLLVPLAFFLFPACLILMLGPFILQLLESF